MKPDYFNNIFYGNRFNFVFNTIFFFQYYIFSNLTSLYRLLCKNILLLFTFYFLKIKFFLLLLFVNFSFNTSTLYNVRIIHNNLHKKKIRDDENTII